METRREGNLIMMITMLFVVCYWLTISLTQPGVFICCRICWFAIYYNIHRDNLFTVRVLLTLVVVTILSIDLIVLLLSFEVDSRLQLCLNSVKKPQYNLEV